MLFEGTDVRELDPLDLRRRAVLVPQVPTPIPGTVADNVSYGARLLHRTVDVEGLLEHVALPRGCCDRDAGRLSVGEQQRLMLARALALEPRRCCSTSRPPRSTRSRVTRSSGRSSTSATISASRSCSSPTTASRRSGSPTHFVELAA